MNPRGAGANLLPPFRHQLPVDPFYFTYTALCKKANRSAKMT